MATSLTANGTVNIITKLNVQKSLSIVQIKVDMILMTHVSRHAYIEKPNLTSKVVEQNVKLRLNNLALFQL